MQFEHALHLATPVHRASPGPGSAARASAARFAATRVVEAQRKAARQGVAEVSADGAELLAGLQSELAEGDAKLGKLGVDPKGPEPAGLAARSMLADRTGLVERIEALWSGAAPKEMVDIGALLAEALTFSPSAWAKVLSRAAEVPAAFPAGFADAWRALPLSAATDAGPADLVEPLKAG